MEVSKGSSFRLLSESGCAQIAETLTPRGTTEEGGWDKKNQRHYEAGEFMVNRITDNNNFVCVRVGFGEDEAEEVELFEMCHCIPKIRKYEEE